MSFQGFALGPREGIIRSSKKKDVVVVFGIAVFCLFEATVKSQT
jgi:hypothetical protein